MIFRRGRNKSLPAQRDQGPRQGPARQSQRACQAIALPWVQWVLTSQRLVPWSRQQETAGEVRTFCSTLPARDSHSDDCAGCNGCRATHLKSFAQFCSLRRENLTMSTFRVTGRHLSWLACVLLAPGGRAFDVCRADDLMSPVNSESRDLAGAFRGLDQSYQYRGMSSRLASTAGSASVDQPAAEVRPELQHPVRAPDHVLVGCAKTDDCCSQCNGNSGHRSEPQGVCWGCSTGCHTPVCGSNTSYEATIGIPLHPRSNHCRATIGIPLHPHAFYGESAGCHKCEGEYNAVGAGLTSHDFFVVEEYRDGRLTRAVVPAARRQSVEQFQLHAE